MLTAIISGIVLCFANALAAVLTYRIAYKREIGDYNRIVLGSLVIRYMLMVAAAWTGMTLLEFDKLAFPLTLLIASFVFLIAEILYIHSHRKTDKKK